MYKAGDILYTPEGDSMGIVSNAVQLGDSSSFYIIELEDETIMLDGSSIFPSVIKIGEL